MRQCLSYYHICAHEYLGFLCQSLHLGVVFPVCLLLVIVVGQETHQFIPVEQKVEEPTSKAVSVGLWFRSIFALCQCVTWQTGGAASQLFL